MNSIPVSPEPRNEQSEPIPLGSYDLWLLAEVAEHDGLVASILTRREKWACRTLRLRGFLTLDYTRYELTDAGRAALEGGAE